MNPTPGLAPEHALQEIEQRTEAIRRQARLEHEALNAHRGRHYGIDALRRAAHAVLHPPRRHTRKEARA